MALRAFLPGFLLRYLLQLRFPALLGVTALLFAADLVIPDMLPMADEILLGLATAALATWKKRRGLSDAAEPAQGVPLAASRSDASRRSS